MDMDGFTNALASMMKAPDCECVKLEVEALDALVEAPEVVAPNKCAFCGKSDDALKTCTGCKAVKYCNRECQLAHRNSHKKECVGRKKILKDAELFAEPPPREKCPICMLTMPFNAEHHVYNSCCGSNICVGCLAENERVRNETNAKRAIEDLPYLEATCPFCRTEIPDDEEDAMARNKKRMELGDAQAYYNAASLLCEGPDRVPNTKSIELHRKAAELGSAAAALNMALFYRLGKGIEQDFAKYLEYTELAAKLGHFRARHNLGAYEMDNGNYARAIKHWLISAAQGHESSLEGIAKMHMRGYVSKEKYDAVNRACEEVLAEADNTERERARAMGIAGSTLSNGIYSCN